MPAGCTRLRVAPVCPISASLQLLSCALAGVGRLGVRPRSLPPCRQRLCPRPSARLRPSRASEPSPLLSFHALPPFAALVLSCSTCVPLPLYPLAPPSFVSLCALGLPPVAWALSLTARFASLGHRLVLLGVHRGGTPLALRPAFPLQLHCFPASVPGSY
jgi:hypothetical protein